MCNLFSSGDECNLIALFVLCTIYFFAPWYVFTCVECNWIVLYCMQFIFFHSGLSVIYAFLVLICLCCIQFIFFLSVQSNLLTCIVYNLFSSCMCRVQSNSFVLHIIYFLLSAQSNLIKFPWNCPTWAMWAAQHYCPWIIKMANAATRLSSLTRKQKRTRTSPWMVCVS